MFWDSWCQGSCLIYLYLLIKEIVIEGLLCAKSMLRDHSLDLTGKGSPCSQDGYTLTLSLEEDIRWAEKQTQGQDLT